MHKKDIYIVGNWKMNPVSCGQAKVLFKDIDDRVGQKSDNCKVALCVPSLFLNFFKERNSIALGAQNIFWEESGAYTGEISAQMIKQFGASYVILGHSERRRFLGETDEMINLKVKSSLDSDLKTILCIGESLEERKNGELEKIIIRQLEEALKGVKDEQVWQKLIIAYEPIWAIGSGEIPSGDDIMSIGLLIKKIINKIYKNRQIIENIPILYGGSVNSKNAVDLTIKTGLDGVLVGGASLKPEEFIEIVKRFSV